MKTIILAIIFTVAPAASSAVAQEFSADMPAMGEILSRAKALQVKHSGRPPKAYLGRYSAKFVRFELSDAAADRSIHILYKDSIIASIQVTQEELESLAAAELTRIFEATRTKAATQGTDIVVDYDAIARHNKDGAWDRAFIRVEEPKPFHAYSS
jgi:hypothetical protein